jgi:hypothetical protein
VICLVGGWLVDEDKCVVIGQSCTGLVDYKMMSLCLSNLFFDATKPIDVGCVQFVHS